jgi:outer membrane receptor for ferrienterochelin and colicins
MKKSTLFLFGTMILMSWITSSAQPYFRKDSLGFYSDTLFVTANKSERQIKNISVPISIINGKNIIQSGNTRLSDVLREQTGITLTSGFGAGVQLQGLNPDYTIILIDGEPLIGRTAGVLDLNRIAVGNIKKIEIVKGPSSSLYGSEAMAGVINIITDKKSNDGINTSIRYGSYKTFDGNFSLTKRWNKIKFQSFYNNYSTDGFSVRPNSNNRFITPITRSTFTQNIQYNITNKTSIEGSFRYNKENIKSIIAVANNGTTIYSNGNEANNDLNGTFVINHQFNDKIKTKLNTYYTQYESKQDLLTVSGNPYNDLFQQNFKRVEDQTEWKINKSLNSIVGFGWITEKVNSTRYDNVDSAKNNTIKYFYNQWEWNAGKKLVANIGFRYDDNKNYASALSPKASFLYKLNSQLRFKLSVGRGFKAPDFRQLYLNFTNAAAGSYSVFGAVEAQKVISKLNQLGQIGNLFSNYYQLKKLEPEYATGIHLSAEWEPNQSNEIQVQLFRNDINNLIDVQQVGNYISGSQIYSYLNIKNAYTTGLEIETKQKYNSNWSSSFGYQFLVTGDKDQIAKIKSGIVYTKNADGTSRLLTLSDYVGLPNTSKHRFQAKLNYENQEGIYANIRAIYRSKWAVANTNGNEVYDNGDQFGKGYIILNFSTGKQFKNGWAMQAGIDNINNHIDGMNLPNLAGRTYYMILKYSIQNKK